MTFRGQNVKLYDTRPALFVYAIRHVDGKPNIPATIEPHVFANLYGYVRTESPLDFGTDGYIELNKDERKDFKREMEFNCTVEEEE